MSTPLTVSVSFEALQNLMERVHALETAIHVPPPPPPPTPPVSKRQRILFSDEAIRQIRNSNDTGVVLAQRFGVSMSYISNIKNKKIYGHVADA